MIQYLIKRHMVSNKKTFLLFFFLSLSFLLASYTYEAKLELLSKIFYYGGLGVYCIIIVKNLRLPAKIAWSRFILFLLFSTSFLLAFRQLNSLPVLSEMKTNPGMILFYLYAILTLMMKFPQKVTLLFIFISFYQVLILSLGSYTFSAEIFATFAFSIIFIGMIHETITLLSISTNKQKYE